MYKKSKPIDSANFTLKDFLDSIGLNISTVIANFEIKVEKSDDQ